MGRYIYLIVVLSIFNTTAYSQVSVEEAYQALEQIDAVIEDEKMIIVPAVGGILVGIGASLGVGYAWYHCGNVELKADGAIKATEIKIRRVQANEIYKLIPEEIEGYIKEYHFKKQIASLDDSTVKQIRSGYFAERNSQYNHLRDELVTQNKFRIDGRIITDIDVAYNHMVENNIDGYGDLERDYQRVKNAANIEDLKKIVVEIDLEWARTYAESDLSAAETFRMYELDRDEILAKKIGLVQEHVQLEENLSTYTKRFKLARFGRYVFGTLSFAGTGLAFYSMYSYSQAGANQIKTQISKPKEIDLALLRESLGVDEDHEFFVRLVLSKNHELRDSIIEYQKIIAKLKMEVEECNNEDN